MAWDDPSSSSTDAGSSGYHAALAAAETAQRVLKRELAAVEAAWAAEHGKHTLTLWTGTLSLSLSCSLANALSLLFLLSLAASLIEQLARKDETIWQLAHQEALRAQENAPVPDPPKPKPPRLGHRARPDQLGPVFALREAGAMVQTPPKRVLRAQQQQQQKGTKPPWDDGRPKPPKQQAQPGGGAGFAQPKKAAAAGGPAQAGQAKGVTKGEAALAKAKGAAAAAAKPAAKPPAAADGGGGGAAAKKKAAQTSPKKGGPSKAAGKAKLNGNTKHGAVDA